VLRNAGGDALSATGPLPGALLRNGAAREWSQAV